MSGRDPADVIRELSSQLQIIGELHDKAVREATGKWHRPRDGVSVYLTHRQREILAEGRAALEDMQQRRAESVPSRIDATDLLIEERDAANQRADYYADTLRETADAIAHVTWPHGEDFEIHPEWHGSELEAARVAARAALATPDTPPDTQLAEERRIMERDELGRAIVADYDRRREHWWGRFLLWLLRKTT